MKINKIKWGGRGWTDLEWVEENKIEDNIELLIGKVNELIDTVNKLSNTKEK